MKKLIPALLFTCCIFFAYAQQDSAKNEVGVIIVPYQSMMYFSDADPDYARASKMDEMKIRSSFRNNLEANVYHQLLSSFNAISLMRANTINGEVDLNKIYGCTRYVTYSRKMQDAYHEEKSSEATSSLKSFTERFKQKSKNQLFWTSDSSVMLANIGDKTLFPYLYKKYKQKYILFITQLEINTSNKNSIEWLKEDYKREYTVHYNLFDHTGALIRAEVLTIRAGNENNIKDINSKYLVALAGKLKEILLTTAK